MTDEHLSDGEVRRTFDRMDRRIDDLAKTTVPLDAWNRETLHQDQACKDRNATAMKAIEAIDKGRQSTTRNLLAIVAILATLLAGWWAAWAAAKGIH